MRFINRKTLAIAGAAAALVAVGSTGTAVAGSLIGSSDIQDDSIRSIDIKDGSVKRARPVANPINRARARTAPTARTASTVPTDADRCSQDVPDQLARRHPGRRHHRACTTRS